MHSHQKLFDINEFYKEVIQNSEKQLAKDEQKLLLELMKKYYHDHMEFQKFAASKMDARLFHQQEANQQKIREPNLVQSFSQAEMLKDINPNEHKTLHGLNKEFDGLCEIISNFVIIKDLIGKKTPEQKFLINHNQLKNQINIPNLNKKEISHSHILKTSNIFAKLLAIIFEIYPHSIIPAFSDILLKDDSNKYRINADLLRSQLNEVKVGAYIKFMVFKRDGLAFSGHSMVIKKISANQYSFFDPNKGEYQGLNIDALARKINEAIVSYGGDRVAFIDGQKYIADLGISIQASKEDGIKINKRRV